MENNDRKSGLRGTYKKVLDFIKGELEISIALGLVFALVIASVMAAPEDENSESHDAVTVQSEVQIQQSNSLNIDNRNHSFINLTALRRADGYTVPAGNWDNQNLLQSTDALYTNTQTSAQTTIELTQPFSGKLTLFAGDQGNYEYSATINGATKGLSPATPKATYTLSNAEELNITLVGNISVSALAPAGQKPDFITWLQPETESSESEEPGVIAENITIQLAPNNLRIEEDSTSLIFAITTNSDGDRMDIGMDWESNDKTVATVDENGRVTGVGAGSATITATAVDYPSLSASVTVSVSPEPSISAAPQNSNLTVTNGESVSTNVNLTPNSAIDPNSTARVSVDAPANTNVNINPPQTRAKGSATVTFTPQLAEMSEAQSFTVPVRATDGIDSWPGPSINLTVTPAPAEETPEEGDEETDEQPADNEQADQEETEENEEISTLPAPEESPDGEITTDEEQEESAQSSDAVRERIDRAVAQRTVGVDTDELDELDEETKQYIQDQAKAQASQETINDALEQNGVTGIRSIIERVRFNAQRFVTNARTLFGLDSAQKTRAREAVNRIENEEVRNQVSSLVNKPSLGDRVGKVARNVGRFVTDLFTGDEGAGATGSDENAEPTGGTAGGPGEID